MKKLTILAVGRTGYGKSTFCNIFCDLNATVSSSVGPGTNESKLHGNKEFRYIDTIGLGDPKKRPSWYIFEDMMEEMRKYADNKEFKIDIILWFVTPDIRKVDSFQLEAKFIKDLGDYGSENDVWESVILITKGNPDEDNWKIGAKSAAEEASGRTLNLPTFQGWVLGCNPDSSNDKRYEDKKQAYRNDPDKLREYREERGWHTKEEARKKLLELSTCRNSFTVHFISEKCKKCQKEIDPRILKGPCHPSLEKVHGGKKQRFQHSQSLQKYHTKELHNYHSKELRKYHNQSLRKYHSQGLRKYHVGSEDYHPGDTRDFDAIWKGAAVGSSGGIIGFAFGAAAGLAYAAIKDRTCVSCENSISKSRGCKTRCTNCKKDLSEEGCKVDHPCCGRNDGGCQKDHPCCGKNDSGCQEDYSCCGRKRYDVGCKASYPCCERNDDGCQEKYACCGRKINDVGCQHKDFLCERCNGDYENTSGCILKCCKKEPKSNGCDEDARHCV